RRPRASRSRARVTANDGANERSQKPAAAAQRYLLEADGCGRFEPFAGHAVHASAPVDDDSRLEAIPGGPVRRSRALDDGLDVLELHPLRAGLGAEDEAIRKDLDVPRRLVAERAERRAAALRVRPQSLARVRAAIDEALPRDLDRREIALVPEDRVALHIANARSRAREREHLIGSDERFGRPQ